MGFHSLLVILVAVCIVITSLLASWISLPSYLQYTYAISKLTFSSFIFILIRHTSPIMRKGGPRDRNQWTIGGGGAGRVLYGNIIFFYKNIKECNFVKRTSIIA